MCHKQCVKSPFVKCNLKVCPCNNLIAFGKLLKITIPTHIKKGFSFRLFYGSYNFSSY